MAMNAEEFLSRHAPSPARLRTQHDDINSIELDRLESKFGPSTSDPRSDLAHHGVLMRHGGERADSLR